MGFIFYLFVQLSVQANTEQNQISKVLDNFHQAASDANQQQYFELLTDNAIFIGTDATERWNKKRFKAFAKPYFDEGNGWTYLSRDRHVTVANSGQVAWFDEMLDNQSYGECRGTGVLELTHTGWKISQYHLTIPLPNVLAKNIVGQIKELQQSPVK
jgi:ketosteroid isomerase-like protein